MTLNDFVNKYKDKRIPDHMGSYLGECLSLVKVFLKETYGFNPPASGCGSAYCYWTNFPNPLGDYFVKVNNTKSWIPKPGTIIVWNTNYGKYGHIAICISATADTVTCFSQNDPLGSPCIIKTYNYSNIYGGLEPKENMADTVQLDSATFEKLVKNSTSWDEVKKLGYTSASQIEADINNYKEDIKNLKAEASSERARADANRQEFVDLLARIARALNVVQEVVQVNSAIDKVSTDLDLLDDLKRQYSELQLHSNEEKEELNAEINRLKLLKSSLDDATFEELLGKIISKLINIVRKNG